MSFEARHEHIYKLLENAIYEIPRNQRKYVWKEENWNDLFSDVLFATKSKKSHFMGSVVLKKEESKQGLDSYTIIDGQQRLTTITLLIIAIMLHFKCLQLKDDFGGTRKYIQSKNNKDKFVNIFCNDYYKALDSFIEAMMQSDFEEPAKFSIQGFIDLNTVAIKKEKVIGNCLKFYYEKVSEEIESSGDPVSRLIEIRDNLIQMSYVHIVATEEDSYTIFEILNARGQALSDHELLKNYIMRYIKPVDQRDSVKNNWEQMETELGKSINSFIKHYAPHKFKASEELRKQPYNNIRRSADIKVVEKLFSDILLKAKYYSKLNNPILVDPDGNNVCSKLEYEIFKFFKSKRQEQFRPIILSLMHQSEMGVLSGSSYDKTLKYIYNFFVCYSTVGRETSNRITDIIYKYAPALENDFSDDELEKFMVSLKERIPNESWFKNAFRNIGYSNHWGLYKEEVAKERCKLILEVTEKHYSSKSEVSEFTIEHILPDSESEENAKIGNLLPLEECLNKRCGNKSLVQKIEIYKESQFISVKKFVERYANNLENFSLNNRTEHMAKLFYNDILKIPLMKEDKNSVANI